MNIKDYDKFLPIGSVVLLENGTNRLMINGYCPVNDDEKNVKYDYSGVLFPEGLLNSEQNYVFNHSQIVRLDFLGLSDKEQQDFIERLKDALNKEAS